MKELKRIFLVSNTAWSLYNFRQGVINYFLKNGYEVYCLAPEDEYIPALKRLGVQFIHTDIDAKGTNPFRDLAYFLTLKRLYKTFRPDFVFHYTVKPNIYGAFVCRLLDIPSVSVVSGAGAVFLQRNLLFRFVKWLYKHAADCAEEFWFINNDDKDFFVREGIVAGSKVKVLPGEGINSEWFQRSSSYAQLSDQHFSFLFSARLLWVKGIQYYVEAARRLKKEYPGARFFIIGFFDKEENRNAVKRADIEAWVHEGIVEYLGVFKDVKPVLETINCLVFPSFYREGVPRVLLEAASMEIPIITTDNVGCTEVVIHGENGFLCQLKDAESVYQNMKKVLELPAEYLQKMGQKGRELMMAQFDEQYVLHYYESMINRYFAPENRSCFSAVPSQAGR